MKNEFESKRKLKSFFFPLCRRLQIAIQILPFRLMNKFCCQKFGLLAFCQFFFFFKVCGATVFGTKEKMSQSITVYMYTEREFNTVVMQQKAKSYRDSSNHWNIQSFWKGLILDARQTHSYHLSRDVINNTQSSLLVYFSKLSLNIANGVQ